MNASVCSPRNPASRARSRSCASRASRASSSPISRRRSQSSWNGQDFYVAFGDADRRSWEDARRYGFVSGDGAKWYSQTLQALFPGTRVFLYIPKTGYVGVGRVTETAQRADSFLVTVNGAEIPIREAPLHAPLGSADEDDDHAEYVVGVDWIKTFLRARRSGRRACSPIRRPPYECVISSRSSA